jgi:hypothetical protein
MLLYFYILARYAIYPFKFCGTKLADIDQHTSVATDEVSILSDDKGGTIEVQLFEAYEDTTAPLYRFKPAAKGLPGTMSDIDKDMKFWTQPSATISYDENNVKTAAKAPPARPWRTSSDKPCITWKGYYHTSNVIRILRMFHAQEQGQDGGDNELPIEHEPGDGPAAIDIAPANKKAKTSDPPIVIDLT